MGDEADADWQDGLIEWGHENATPSWYCEPCAVEVYDRRCPHCGKTERERT
jgi:predicted RNA-binding protein with PUA domain